ncbi:MAG: hypothetical protein JNK29_18635, partial [Anaerolineales bacterium]|nr:hypothetical protein [Anaerolineales bacterium]
AAWRELDALNRAALAQAGTPAEVGPAAQAALDVIRGEGALVWGQSLTGLALYGLVRGVDASHALRKALRAHAGHEGGTVTATLMAPAGAVIREQEGALTQPDPPIRMVGPDAG